MAARSNPFRFLGGDARSRSGGAGIVYALAIVPMLLTVFLPIEYGFMLRDAEVVKTTQLKAAVAAHQEIVSRRAAIRIAGEDPESDAAVNRANAEARGQIYAALNIALRAPNRGYLNDMTVSVQSSTDLCARTTFAGEARPALANVLNMRVPVLSEEIAVAGEYGDALQVRATCTGHTRSAFFRRNLLTDGNVAGAVGAQPNGFAPENGHVVTVADVVSDFDRNGRYARHVTAGSGPTTRVALTTTPLSVYTAHVAIYIPSQTALSGIVFTATGDVTSATSANADIDIRDRWQVLRIQFATNVNPQNVRLRLSTTSPTGAVFFSDAWGFFLANAQ